MRAVHGWLISFQGTLFSLLLNGNERTPLVCAWANPHVVYRLLTNPHQTHSQTQFVGKTATGDPGRANGEQKQARDVIGSGKKSDNFTTGVIRPPVDFQWFPSFSLSTKENGSSLTSNARSEPRPRWLEVSSGLLECTCGSIQRQTKRTPAFWGTP